MADQESDVRFAIINSNRLEINPKTKLKNTIGFDIFEILGHQIIGDEVYLTLGNRRWVRSLEVLKNG